MFTTKSSKARADSSLASDDLLARVTASVGALDVGAENDSIAELREDQARIRTAIEDGRARFDKVRDDQRISSGPNGASVANALLAGGRGVDVLGAAGRTKDELETERAALTEALTELRRREDAAGREIERIRRQARRRLHGCMVPLIDALEQDARTAARQIVDIYTVLRAIALATETRFDADHLTEKATCALSGSRTAGLVTRTEKLQVPDSIYALLLAAERKGEATSHIAYAAIPAPVLSRLQ
jgi:hypothetical protein